MENFNQRFGRLMATKMTKKNYTQYDVSAFCEVSQGTISAYVYGKTSPRLDVALKICQFLDIQLNEIK
jgi:transcriptional regulator with XRE-family HTH domain